MLLFGSGKKKKKNKSLVQELSSVCPSNDVCVSLIYLLAFTTFTWSLRTLLVLLLLLFL